MTGWQHPSAFFSFSFFFFFPFFCFLFFFIFFLFFFFIVIKKEETYDDVSNAWHNKGEGKKSWGKTHKSSGRLAPGCLDISGMESVVLKFAEKGGKRPTQLAEIGLLLPNTTSPRLPGLQHNRKPCVSGDRFLLSCLVRQPRGDRWQAHALKPRHTHHFLNSFSLLSFLLRQNRSFFCPLFFVSCRGVTDSQSYSNTTASLSMTWPPEE